MSRHDDTSGTERHLLISAIEHYRDHQLSEALALLERGGSALGNVRSVVSFFEELVVDGRCHDCLLIDAVARMCPHDAEVASQLLETLELLRGSLERSLHEARASGELAQGKSPERLSWALANALIGQALTGYADTLSMLD